MNIVDFTSHLTCVRVMASRESIVQTSTLKSDEDRVSPYGSEIRLLPTMKGGDLCHCKLPEGKTWSPVARRRVEEIWYLLEGGDEHQRKSSVAEDVVRVGPRMSLTFSPHTALQFRNTGTVPLGILIAIMPPCPGPRSAERAVGPWLPTITPGAEQVDEVKGRVEP